MVISPLGFKINKKDHHIKRFARRALTKTFDIMANTYTQIYIQYIFAVQNRVSLIKDHWQTDLYKYMTGIIEQQEH